MTAYAWQGSGAWEIPDFLRRALQESGIGGTGFGHGWPGGPGGHGGPGRSRTRGAWSGGRPGGPWGWGSWDRQGPKATRAGRGDVRSAVLALLTEEPMHGYQIIQEIGRRSGGAWKPSPGSVYPTLQQLEDEGLVRADEQEGRRVYRLTDAGRATRHRAGRGVRLALGGLRAERGRHPDRRPGVPGRGGVRPCDADRLGRTGRRGPEGSRPNQNRFVPDSRLRRR